MVRISVWKCQEHGEFEMPESGGELIEAHCPRCGKLMTRVGGYDE